MKRTLIPLLLSAAVLLIVACDSPNRSVVESSQEAVECGICGAEVTPLGQDTLAACLFCGEQFATRTLCSNGHYVCDACHEAHYDSIMIYCLQQESKNPIEILEGMMDQSYCPMHGPVHHVLVGAALMTAYHNAGGEADLMLVLPEMIRRGRQVPGGACGSWGSCGAVLSSGMFLSIVTGNSPLAVEEWNLCSQMVGDGIQKVGSIGGPRCCKRDSYTAVINAVEFTKTHLGVAMELPEVVCTRSQNNRQCIGSRCPYNPAHHAGTR